MQPDERQRCGFQERLPPAVPLHSINLTLEIDRLQTGAERRRHHELMEPAILRDDLLILKKRATDCQATALWLRKCYFPSFD